MSWWSYRVSIPFSLLCLVLLIHFHKNASFRPNMLYLNTIFTFGKQTKDNFINRKFQCRSTYSLTHFVSVSLLGRVAGAAALGDPKYLTINSNLIVLLTPHPDGAKQGRRCSHVTWSLDDLCTHSPAKRERFSRRRVCDCLCPSQMAYWAKSYVTIFTRAAHWITYINEGRKLNGLLWSSKTKFSQS